ncbi:MAG: VOC family protein [Dehalococcoidia bacterium]
MSILFDHVALAARQRDPIRDFVLDLLGGRVIVEQRSPQTEMGFRGVQIDIGGALLEVIEPTSPASFLHPFLAKRGPGLHHLTWYVKGLDAFLARLDARGVALTGVEHDADGAATNAFTRPSASFGVLLQFRPHEDKKREKKRNSADWENLPAPAPNRGKLAATSIAAADGEATLAFFQATLGGDVSGPTARGDRVVRTLTTGGTRLEFVSPADPSGDGERAGGLDAVTFELTAFAETIATAEAMGLTVLPGEDACTRYLAPTNPTGARFRLVDVGG